MRTVAHISDLHFGTEDPRLVEGLLADLHMVAPHLVTVSGDLTQRAQGSQFAAASAFLDRIPAPKLVVPGNHDIPLFNVARRFLRPLVRYRRYITDDLAPTFRDAELAALGLNTARSNVWKSGRISVAQIDLVRSYFCPLPPPVFKILVTHHPFIPRPGDPVPALVARVAPALEAAEACGVDLLLSGHLHVGYTGDVRAHHVSIRRSILVAQAGTAVSHRRRDEANSYNLVTVEPAAEPPVVACLVRAWDGARFAAHKEARYVKTGEEWRPAG